MDAATNLIGSKKSLFNRAAWCSFFIPLATVAVTFLLLFADSRIGSDAAGIYLFWAFWIQAISLILGIASLFGIPKHGARLILWKAALGILLSCGMGFVIFVLAVGNAMGHNC